MKELDLTQGSVPKVLLHFAVPFLLANVLQALYGGADLFVVGQYDDDASVAAVAIGSQVMQTVTGVILGLTTGTTVLIAIATGAKDYRKTASIIGTSIGLFAAVGAVLTFLMVAFHSRTVQLMHTPPEALADTEAYLWICSLGIPFIIGYNVVCGILRGLGDSRTPLYFVALACALNIVLDFLFLVVFRWGVAAAAAASCLSIALGTVLGFLPFVMGRLPLRFVRGTISARQLGNILANGSSEFFSSIAGSVMMVILNSVLLRLSGSMAVAAFSIVMYVDSIVGSLLFGMADSIQPAISYNYGARRRDRMLALEKRVLLTGAAVSLAALLWMQLGGQYVIPLFIQGDDPALLEMSLRAMRLFSLSYLLGWAGTCLSSFFTALNRPGRSLILAFSKTLVFPLACLAVLPAALGLDGVWLTAPAAGVLTAALAVWFLIAVLRQERAQDRQEGEGTPQA